MHSTRTPPSLWTEPLHSFFCPPAQCSAERIWEAMRLLEHTCTGMNGAANGVQASVSRAAFRPPHRGATGDGRRAAHLRAGRLAGGGCGSPGGGWGADGAGCAAALGGLTGGSARFDQMHCWLLCRFGTLLMLHGHLPLLMRHICIWPEPCALHSIDMGIAPFLLLHVRQQLSTRRLPQASGFGAATPHRRRQPPAVGACVPQAGAGCRRSLCGPARPAGPA